MSRYYVVIFLLFVCKLLGADYIAPDVMLNEVTQNCVNEIKSHIELIKKNDKCLNDIVEKHISPIVDYQLVAKWVSDRNSWLAADEETHIGLENELKIIFNRTYSRYLLDHYHKKIEYLPATINNNRAQVSSIIHLGVNDVYKLNYKLALSDNTWKVYDISFQGISLVKGYKAQFANLIKELGLSGLVEKLHKLNQEASLGI